MTEPKIQAFAVCLSFREGPLILNACVAPSAESAAAMTAMMAGKQRELPNECPGVAVVPMSVEWLRWALRTVEAGEPHTAPVVSLVSDNLRSPAEILNSIQNVPTERQIAEMDAGLIGDTLRHIARTDLPDPA